MTDSGFLAVDFCDHLKKVLFDANVSERWGFRKVVDEAPASIQAGDVPMIYVEVLSWATLEEQLSGPTKSATIQIEGRVTILAEDLDHPTLEEDLRKQGSQVFEWLQEHYSVDGYCDYMRAMSVNFGAQVSEAKIFGSVEIDVTAIKTITYEREP